MEHFTCCKCLTKVHGGTKGLFIHLRFIHGILKSTCTRLVCAEAHCNQIFWRGSSYKRHLELNHVERRNNDVVQINEGVNQAEDVNDQNQDELPGNEFDGALNEEPEGVERLAELIEEKKDTNIKDNVATFIARLRSLPIPSTIIDNFIKESKDLFETISQQVEECMSPIINNVQSGILPTNDMIDEAKRILSTNQNPFSELETEYKQNKYLKDAGFLVEPQSITLAKHHRTVTEKNTGRNIQVEHSETFQYIPLKDNMVQFLHQPGVMSSIIQEQPSDDANILESYRDGIFFKNTFSAADDDDDVNEQILPILLYVDDFETANPLGPKKGVYKLTAVYMSFLCLPSKYQASLRNILLIALSQAPLVAKHGLDKILQPVMQELEVIGRTGIHINVPGEYVGIVRPKLFQVIGDNLAVNIMTGYTACFVSNYFCRVCKMHREETHVATTEKEELIRNQQNFALDLEKSDISKTGICRDSVLNSLPYFHVTSNIALDIMHDFLEGILPLEFKLVIGKLIEDGKLTLDDINSRISSFNYGFTDKKNRPCPLTNYQINNPKGASGQKAAQMKCLALYFPLIVGDKVDEDSAEWELLLLIIDIFKLIVAPRMSKQATYLLRTKIEEHHTLFQELFPDMNLTPKQHLCTHYPRAIRLLGPLTQFNVIRMEGKHKQLKNWAKASNNFINIALTLAKRHQQAKGFEYLMKEHIGSRGIEIANQFMEKLSALRNGAQLSVLLNCLQEEYIVVATSVTINGYIFKPNVMVLISWVEEPQFANVEIILIRNGNVLLVIKPWKTIYYDHHFCAYMVKDQHIQEEIQVKSPQDLYDHRPLHAAKCNDARNRNWYIVTPYTIA